MATIKMNAAVKAESDVAESDYHGMYTYYRVEIGGRYSYGGDVWQTAQRDEKRVAPPKMGRPKK